MARRGREAGGRPRGARGARRAREARPGPRGARHGPFRHRVFVRFGHIDHAGIVYYPRFFEFFHEAFEEMFRRRLRREYADILDARGLGFPTVRAACEFHDTVRFGDRLDVRLAVRRIGRTSVEFHYAARKAGSRRPCAEAAITVVCIRRRSFRPTPIPPDLRARLATLRVEPRSGRRRGRVRRRRARAGARTARDIRRPGAA